MGDSFPPVFFKPSIRDRRKFSAVFCARSAGRFSRRSEIREKYFEDFPETPPKWAIPTPVWVKGKFFLKLAKNALYRTSSRWREKRFFEKFTQNWPKQPFALPVMGEGGNARSCGRGRAWVVRERFYRGAIIRCPLILSHRNLVGDCIPQTLLLRLTPERAPKIKSLRICEHWKTAPYFLPFFL